MSVSSDLVKAHQESLKNTRQALELLNKAILKMRRLEAAARAVVNKAGEAFQELADISSPEITALCQAITKLEKQLENPNTKPISHEADPCQTCQLPTYGIFCLAIATKCRTMKVINPSPCDCCTNPIGGAAFCHLHGKQCDGISRATKDKYSGT